MIKQFTFLHFNRFDSQNQIYKKKREQKCIPGKNTKGLPRAECQSTRPRVIPSMKNSSEFLFFIRSPNHSPNGSYG